MWLLSVLFVCVVTVLYRWYSRPRGVPPPVYPGRLPFIGHLKYFAIPKGDNVEFWNRLKNVSTYCYDNGGVCTLYIGTHRYYVVADPDDGLKIATQCLDKSYFYKYADDFVGNNLVNTDVQTWKLHRKLLNPTFNMHVLNSFLEVFNEQNQQLVATLASKVGKSEFDVQPFLINTLLRIVCQTSLGLLPSDTSIIDETYAHAADSVMLAMYRRTQMFWMHISFIYNMSSLKKTFTKYTKVLTDIANMIIDERKRTIRDDKNVSTEKFRPILDQLLVINKEQGVFTENDIREHLNTFIMASYDTTATTTTFALLLLGTHQDIQEKVYQEVKNVVVGNDVTKYDLLNLVYTEAVVKECVRLYPILPLVGRHIDKDLELKNYTIQAGSSCTLSLYGMSRNPHVWGKDADKFRPERWLDPETLPKSPGAYASFSLGKRNCIGRQYALISIKTTLAHIVKKYQVFGDITKLVLKTEILLKPESGHHISLKLRDPIS